MNGIEIKKRYDQLYQERQASADQTFDLIERYVVPFRGKFYQPLNTESEVNWRKRDIYDSTAVIAAQILSASIQGALTSPSIKWFSLAFRDDTLEADDEAREWLDECEAVIYAALQDSNFDLEAAEFYLDLTSFGTGFIFEEVNEDNGELLFEASPIRSSFFEEDWKGNVEKFYRRYQWTANQVITKFGEDSVPDKIKEQNKSASTEKIDIIFCIYPRKRYIDADVSKRIVPEKRPYGYKYILLSDGHILAEGGYYEMPAFVTRWRKTTGSQWGHSPAHVALSDILTLNELIKITLESAGKVVDPPWGTTQRGLLSDLNLRRGGLSVFRSKDDIWPLESNARFDVGELKIQHLQESINRAFHVDQLELKQSPAMTATEVSVRYELMQRLLGPTLGRLQNDFLDPVIQRTFNILFRSGQLPAVPESVATKNAQMDIRYTGPLPRSQRKDTITTTMDWIQLVASLAQVKPEVVDYIDDDEIARGAAALLGVPAKFISDEKKIAQLRESRAKQQEQEQQRQEIETASKAAPLLKEVNK